MSRRTLPLPDRLESVLRAAKARQAAERLAAGSCYRAGEYVVSNEVGDPVPPASAVSVLAGRGEGRRAETDQIARREAHCGHHNASRWSAGRGDRCMDLRGTRLVVQSLCGLGVDGSRPTVEQFLWPAGSTDIGINTTRLF
jgi:hypothetical protein